MMYGSVRAQFAGLVCMLAWLGAGPVRGDGLTWPAGQLLPTFSTPAPVLDCIDVSSASDPEADLFSSLQGVVNRTQPRIACVHNVDGEGKFTWLDLHNLPYTLINGYSGILKYRTNVTALVVTDPNQPDTLNLATTIAGVSNQLICHPSLLATLTNSPYSLPIGEDLRGRFTDKYQVYGYLYTNYWPQCTHRMMSGLWTNLHGNFRDYLVAVKAATVWLDPGITADKNLLARFMADIPPMNGIYTGWWPNEGNGLNWISSYGIPVLASDYFRNGSVFSGVTRSVNVPDIPPPPPLENKVYVAFIISDGDNIQYMQHAMKMRWGQAARGTFPIGWTVSPLAAGMDPVLLNHYWSTATANDCLISGPSGAGYTHMQQWSAANLAAFAKATEPYLKRSGVRVITIWDQSTIGVGRSFATNCPSLLGLTDQSGGSYTRVDLGLRTLGLAVAYSSDTNAIYSGITNAARTWNGSAPMFLAVQANVWDLGPTQLRGIVNSLDPNKYVAIRPDHLFLLYNSVFGYPTASTRPATTLAAGNATVQGLVIPNAASAVAWMEWGTNGAYGFKTATVNVSGTTLVTIKAALSGLSARTVYHYRVVASNALGMAYGAEKTFTTGNRAKAWGDGSFGQTNLPAGLTNVAAISAGGNHCLALKNDGLVVAWGDNSSGQTNVPGSLASVVEVTAGAQHSLALKLNGTVTAWGDNSVGQTNAPQSLTNVIAIAAGGYHNLALRADGTVTAWGQNSSGQTNVPAGLSNVVGIAAGGNHSLAVKADGTVTTWGSNASGQTNVPAGLSCVVAVAAGQNHSVALKADGFQTDNLTPTAKWVADSLVGVDSSTVSNWPDMIGGKSAVQNNAVNRPRLYSNALNGHKVVRFVSGGNQYMTVTATNSPISAAGSFTLIVVFKTSTPGSVSSLFYQNTGLLGCEQPNIVADWALCINGTQLGAGLGGGANGCGADLGLYGGIVTDGVPHIAMYVRAGDTITLYVDGAPVAMQTSLCTTARGNYSFQIGAMTSSSYFFNGDIAEIQLFDRALNPVEAVSANEILSATYGIGGVGRTVVAWGSNSNGQTNGPAGLTNLAAIASGGSFNLALRGNGSAVGWGFNSQGQASLLPGLTNVAAVACGTNFGLAIGNQTPLVNSLTVPGYASHDVAITLPGIDPDGNPLSFRLLSLPAAGTLYQSVNGARGTPVTTPNTLVTDPGGRLVFAPAPTETGNPYAVFSFAAEDVFYSSTNAQVRVNVGLPAAPTLANPVWNPGSPAQCQLSFIGDSKATYSLWASTNLMDWIRLGAATETSPAQYEFLDPAAADWPQRFYRVSAP